MTRQGERKKIKKSRNQELWRETEERMEEKRNEHAGKKMQRKQLSA